LTGSGGLCYNFYMEQDELLRTKLAPPRVPAELVPRPALLARLDEWPARKLILISAPAGFGKTTLLAS
jgi:LuxR family maltose regulon positive regulatory protein